MRPEPRRRAAAGAVGAAFTTRAQAESPSFFVFNGGPWVAATHAKGSYIGPASLYPGSPTPAKPGETVVIYANGFGQTSAAVVSGSEMQSGTLSPPLIAIGGSAHHRDLRWTKHAGWNADNDPPIKHSEAGAALESQITVIGRGIRRAVSRVNAVIAYCPRGRGGSNHVEKVAQSR